MYPYAKFHINRTVNFSRSLDGRKDERGTPSMPLGMLLIKAALKADVHCINSRQTHKQSCFNSADMNALLFEEWNIIILIRQRFPVELVNPMHKHSYSPMDPPCRAHGRAIWTV